MKIFVLLFLFTAQVFAQTYIQGNNLIEVPTIDSAGSGQLTLTSSSATIIQLTGARSRINLPAANTIQVGRKFYILNNGSTNPPIWDNAGDVILSHLEATTNITLTLTNNGSAAGTWVVATLPAFLVGALDAGSGGSAGASIDTLGNIYMQSASGSQPGLINTGSQTFAGVKTFSSLPVLSGLTTAGVVKTDSSGNLSSVSILGVSNGGTGLSAGTSGGILGFTASGTLSSSGLLTANQVVVGGGSLATPATLVAGSQYQSLTMGASNPGWSAVALNQSAAVSGTLAVANGGTGVTAVTIAPTASSFSGWDANSNLSANNFIPGYTTTATASGTTTLTVGSANQQYFTGSSPQTVKMPVVSTLALGMQYFIVNSSSGIVTVQSSGSNTIQAMAANTVLELTVILTSGTTAASWSTAYYTNNGSVIGTVPIASGGTGQTSATTAFNALSPMTTGGDLIYGGASGAGTRLANGSSGQVLLSAGGTSAPTWSTLAGNTNFKALTVQAFTSTGTQTGWLFTISTSTTCAVGDTYTNNGNTYTVQGALSAQSGAVLFMSGTGATSGTTLARSAGSGTSSVTFSTKIATATYTTPSSPSPVYLEIIQVGGGGGGSGSGTVTGTAATSGTASYFGANIVTTNGGALGSFNGSGGIGGTASVGSAGTQLFAIAGTGGSGSAADGSTGVGVSQAGGAGGPSILSGAGGAPGAAGTTGLAGIAAAANSGSGGSGGSCGNTNASFSGGGGGAGGGASAIIAAPAASYPYAIGAAGSAGGAGTSGSAGGNGAAGQIIVKEHYQ
jgi:hypothetical protein